MTNIPQTIERLLTRGGSWNRVIVESSAGFFVIEGARDHDHLRVLAMAGRHLPAGRTLPAQAHQTMFDVGFRRQTAADPYELKTDSKQRPPTELANLLIHLLSVVYEQQEGSIFTRFCPDEWPQLNPAPLIAAMTDLSRERSAEARHIVYRRLLTTPLLVALSGKAPADELPLRAVGTLSGAPCAAVFTDVASMQRHDPRLTTHRVMPGRTLIPILVAQEIPSLLINPAGPTGGELYRNELQTINAALGVR